MLESLEQYVKACEKVASDLRLGIGVYQILQFLPSPTNWLKSQFSSNVAQKWLIEIPNSLKNQFD